MIWSSHQMQVLVEQLVALIRSLLDQKSDYAYPGGKDINKYIVEKSTMDWYRRALG